MSIYHVKKMQPRNGHTLVVLVVARISGCQSQKDLSLEDQQEHARDTVAEIHDGDEVEYRVIATKGKGELLDRPELADIVSSLKTGEIDVLITEDIGRLVRGAEASRICGIAVDHGTRVLALHDCIDTFEDSWEEDVISACRDHVGHNVHTSKRLKSKLMSRFKRGGRATPVPICGYVKPEDAQSFYDWYVDESAKPIIAEGARILGNNLNCSAVADYFNMVNLPVGPYCRKKVWDGAMVRRYFSNPILKGEPERGNMHSVKHHESGRRRSVKNPEGPVSIEVPNLLIIPEMEFDEINALLDEKNSGQGRKPYANGQDPLKGIPRKRTRFPGQHARCWYCGRIYVWGGNGIKTNLQCTGSRNWMCWNSIGIDGARFCNRVVNAITDMLLQLQGFDQEFRQILESTANRPDPNHEIERQRITFDENAIDRKRQNYLDAIADFGANPDIVKRLNELNQEWNRLAIRKAEIARQSIAPADLPASAEDLMGRLEEEFLSLAIDSYEFGAMLPKIVPDIFIYLVRMCDGGALLPRAKIKIDLSGAFTGPIPTAFREMMIRELTVDVFETPMREKIRGQVIDLLNQGLNHDNILANLPEKTSAKVIGAAIRLDDRMVANSIADPFELQLEPPSDLKKLRRHRNPRFSFSICENYQRPSL